MTPELVLLVLLTPLSLYLAYRAGYRHGREALYERRRFWRDVEAKRRG